MDIVVKFLELFPRLLRISLSCTPFVYLIIAFFVIVLSVNLVCYAIWGRYS